MPSESPATYHEEIICSVAKENESVEKSMNLKYEMDEP